jgi:hypothetical protein
MNILVQHKKNPLDGDSSSTTRGKPSFFLKDASAVHEIPNVVITCLPVEKDFCEGDVAYVYLTVTNPKAVPVHVRIADNNGYNGGPFNRTCTERLRLSSEHDVPLTFTLGCYEDELLRDDDDENDGGRTVASLPMPVRSFSVVSYNAALVKCSIQLDTSVVAPGNIPTVYVLPLLLTIEEVHSTATAAVLRHEVEAVVAIPIGYQPL